MRVLSVAQSYYPFLDEGGRPWKVAAMTHELIARGHHATVLTCDLGLDVAFRKLGVDAVKTRAAWGTRFDHDGVDVHYLDVALRYRVVTLSPRVIQFSIAELRGFDVVHVFGLYDLIGAPVARLCERWGIPYVVEPMGMVVPMVRSVKKKRAYHALLGRRMLARAAGVIATSQQEAAELCASGVERSRITVRRNGIDLSAFDALPDRGAFRREIGVKDREILVLFLGRVSRKKGLDRLVRGMPRLPERVRLAIVGPDDGDGTLRDVERIARDLGLGARVSIAPARYDRAKLEALVDADLFVLPSENENFGNAVIEAAACGVPSVVTDRCGVAPLVDGRAGFVVAYDEAAIADGIRRALDDGPALARMRAEAPRLARELSWSEPMRAMIARYEELARAAAMNTRLGVRNERAG